MMPLGVRCSLHRLRSCAIVRSSGALMQLPGLGHRIHGERVGHRLSP